METFQPLLEGLLIAMTLTILFISPETSIGLWQRMSETWRTYKTRVLQARKERTREKLLKYWEVDMRKFR